MVFRFQYHRELRHLWSSSPQKVWALRFRQYPAAWEMATGLFGEVQENVYHTSWKVLVLVCSCRCKKTSQAGYLINDRNVFLIVLEVGSRRLEASIVRVQRRQWHPTPVLLPGKSHGQRSLVGCSPWGLEESDMNEWLHFHFSLSCVGEGNGNPLQCSCLENPRDRSLVGCCLWGCTESDTTEVT